MGEENNIAPKECKVFINGQEVGISKLDIIKLCENNIGNKFLTPNKNLKILVKDKKIFFNVQKMFI